MKRIFIILVAMAILVAMPIAAGPPGRESVAGVELAADFGLPALGISDAAGGRIHGPVDIISTPASFEFSAPIIAAFGIAAMLAGLMRGGRSASNRLGKVRGIAYRSMEARGWV